MMKRRLIFFLLVVLLGSFFIGNVNARGGVLVVEPMREVVDSIQLTVSNSTSAVVCGNFSVIDAFIDFYVTSPSGVVLLCYNKTEFEKFNFTALENGTYVMHLANRWSTNNVTATLNYGVNWEISLQAEIRTTWRTIAALEMTVQPTTPFDWMETLKVIWALISAIPLLDALHKLLLKFLRRLYWKMKHGKSKTPVVISLTEKITFLYKSVSKYLNLKIAEK